MAFSGDDPVKSRICRNSRASGRKHDGHHGSGARYRAEVDRIPARACPEPENRRRVAIARPAGPLGPDRRVKGSRREQRHWSEGLEARSVDEYSDAFESAGASSQGIVVLSGPEFTRNRFRIVELANRYRLASVYQFSEFVSIGGTLSYGPDITDLSYRAVAYVDKILKGANPAELAIEQPRKLFLVINRKSASALGLTVPAALTLQADKVFQ